MEVSIYPISEGRIEDFLHFFDNVAFTDNKEWSGCYCQFYHFDDEEWELQTGERNRLSAVKSIQEGRMKGYLAYIDGKAIGWCNVNDKSNFSRLVSSKELQDATEGKICSIVCFVIAPEFRKKGVASQILEAIYNDYSNRGYEYVEAYPRKGELTNAQHYHGPMSMYMKAGFLLDRAFTLYDIVRKKL